MWNIDPSIAKIEEGSTPTDAREGRNDFDETGYSGSKPLDREHSYYFRRYALDTDLYLDTGASKEKLQKQSRITLSTRRNSEEHTHRTKRYSSPTELAY